MSSIQIIGCGFGRTGTFSLKIALETLGYRCYHGSEIILDQYQSCPKWRSAWMLVNRLNETNLKSTGGMHGQTKRKDQEISTAMQSSTMKISATANDAETSPSKEELLLWDDIFKGYTATLDWPSSYFYKSLMHANPQAKLILTYRQDFDKWYDSLRDTVYWAENGFPGVLFRWRSYCSSTAKFSGRKNDDGFFTSLNGREQFAYINDAIMWHGLFQGLFHDRELVRTIYWGWIEQVKKDVPPERLLEWPILEAKEARASDDETRWALLCDFLNVAPEKRPRKGTAYPKGNSKEDFQGLVYSLIVRDFKLIGFFSMLGVTLFYRKLGMTFVLVFLVWLVISRLYFGSKWSL